jgi:hypothetical protein
VEVTLATVCTEGGAAVSKAAQEEAQIELEALKCPSCLHRDENREGQKLDAFSLCERGNSSHEVVTIRTWRLRRAYPCRQRYPSVTGNCL